MAAFGQVAFVCDDSAFDFEEEADGAGGLAEGFKVSLTLGDDQVGTIEVVEQLLRALGEPGAGHIGTIADNLDDLGQSGGLGICHGGIVKDWLATHSNCHPLWVKSLYQELVEDNFAGVISQIEDVVGCGSFAAQTIDVAAERGVLNIVDGIEHLLFGDVALGAKVDQVTSDCQAHCELEGVIGVGNSLAQPGQ